MRSSLHITRLRDVGDDVGATLLVAARDVARALLTLPGVSGTTLRLHDGLPSNEGGHVAFRVTPRREDDDFLRRGHHALDPDQRRDQARELTLAVLADQRRIR